MVTALRYERVRDCTELQTCRYRTKVRNLWVLSRADYLKESGKRECCCWWRYACGAFSELMWNDCNIDVEARKRFFGVRDSDR